MEIKIGNIRTHRKDDSIAIKVDRSSVLGNPFYMADESKRNEVCDKYQKYFDKKVSEKSDDKFLLELNRIHELSNTYDITLLCWCYPKRCHAEIIKMYLDSLSQEV